MHLQVGDHSRPVYIPALPRTYFDPVKTYVITGGLGGFGLELTSWMIERGARIIILTSRSGKIKTGYQARQMKIFHDLGAKVSVSSANVCDFQETETFLQSTDTQIGGIFHLAVVSRARFHNDFSDLRGTILSVLLYANGQSMWFMDTSFNMLKHLLEYLDVITLHIYRFDKFILTELLFCFFGELLASKAYNCLQTT